MSAVALVVAFAALVVAALCAAADGALLSADEQARPPGGERGTGGPREHTHRALAITRLIADLVAGTAGAAGLALAQRPPAVGAALAVTIALGVGLLGEVAPRAAGAALGARTLRALAPVVGLVEFLAHPIVVAGARMDVALRRLLPPIQPEDADREVTAAQFRQVVQADTAVPAPQRAILHRVFSLADTEVHEVMVPRVDIVGIDRAAPWSEVLDRVRSAQHARLPVYDETLDHVSGLLFAKDLLPAVIDGEEPPAGWQSLVRPAAFIPESKTIDAQFRDFKASRTHLAIVVDEYGGTAGLVTIEDILEEIVGDIRDEYDREEPPIESEEGKRFWVSGRVTLDDLSDALGHRFEREDVSTVGGLIFELVGRVPRAGQELSLDGFRIVVERVVRRRVDRVYFERQEAPARQEV